ncbi:MAG: hypothetical protein KGL39_30410 [Patescibacteria group bacterium]|nr:hypothetical protein [Patescibacteria group bacterium]
MTRSERFMVRLEPSAAQALRVAALEDGRPISQFLERLIVSDMRRRQLLGEAEIVPLRGVATRKAKT